MPAFATPGPIAATVEVAGAQVRVTASDRTDTVVLVEPINEASRSDVKVASTTKVDFAGGQLSVKTTTPGDESGSVSITIGLPAGSSLAAHLAHSSVQADGPAGQCELYLASGQRRLRHRPRRRHHHRHDSQRCHSDRPDDIRSGEADERLGKHRGRHQRGYRCLHRRQQRARGGAQLRFVAGKP